MSNPTHQLRAGEYELATHPETGETWLQLPHVNLSIPADLVPVLATQLLDRAALV